MSVAEWPLGRIKFKRAEREAAAAATGAEQVAPANAATPGNAASLGDTAVFRTPRIELDEARRDRERILPPGAMGSQGGSYKMLRTQVMRRLQELKANTLAVFSAGKGEGKTLTAINLAIALAADRGHTALLVDLDLRNPSVHERLGFEPELGLEDCLEAGRSVRNAMFKVAGYDRLTILPCRARVEQSSELITSDRMAEMVRELRTRYVNRILIFDLPPVLLADDALAFSRHVQAGLMVVSEGRTARDDVSRSLNLMRNLTVIGTVLNRSRGSVGAYY